MSTGLEARQRPNLWSYISFGSPRRRSVSLPKHSVHSLRDQGSSDYTGELLDYGRSRSTSQPTMTGGQRSRFLKIGGLIVFILIAFYFLSSGGKSSVRDIVKTSKTSAQHGSTDTLSSGSEEDVPFNAALTAKCTKSSAKDKPLIQYVLMIDAGSTGSRIHVYKFHNCGGTPELIDEKFKMTEKKEGGSGLSSYPDDPEAAAQSLDILMEEAMSSVAEELKSCSPVAVKATAGLRKLGEARSAAILKAVRTRLETKYPFPVVDDASGGVQVMDGKDEGVYAWVTTNYLLGKLGGPDKSPTAAIFDLGGGSTQIVFEPTYPSVSGGMPETLKEGDHKYVFENGGHKHELYQHSHLGFGLMAAREGIHRLLVQAIHDEKNGDVTWAEEPIINPCIIPGMSRQVSVTLESGQVYPTTMKGPAEASPAQCRGLVEKLLHKETTCPLAPCSFNGVHQPSLEQTFSREDVYVFSYFYDRTRPLGMPESFTVGELKDLTAKVCAGESSGAWKSFEGIEGAMEELRGRPEGCLDLSFMVGLLHTGYEMGLNREIKIAKKIKSKELGWCLGASLPLLSHNSGWNCRVKQVP